MIGRENRDPIFNWYSCKHSSLTKIALESDREKLYAYLWGRQKRVKFGRTGFFLYFLLCFPALSTDPRDSFTELDHWATAPEFLFFVLSKGLTKLPRENLWSSCLILLTTEIRTGVRQYGWHDISFLYFILFCMWVLSLHVCVPCECLMPGTRITGSCKTPCVLEITPGFSEKVTYNHNTGCGGPGPHNLSTQKQAVFVSSRPAWSQSKVQDSQSYIERPCPKKQNDMHVLPYQFTKRWFNSEP